MKVKIMAAILVLCFIAGAWIEGHTIITYGK